MKNARMQIPIIVVLVGLLLLGLPGCKKKSEPAPSPNTPAKTAGGTPTTVTAVGAIAQTTCPVMDGNPIDKNVFTEYKGQKVYFCCQDCVAKFKPAPKKSAATRPHFKKWGSVTIPALSPGAALETRSHRGLPLAPKPTGYS